MKRRTRKRTRTWERDGATSSEGGLSLQKQQQQKLHSAVIPIKNQLQLENCDTQNKTKAQKQTKMHLTKMFQQLMLIKFCSDFRGAFLFVL